MTTRRWTGIWIAILLVCATVIGAWVGSRRRDRTREMAPMAVAQAAARAIRSAERYRFTVSAEGETRAGRLPPTTMQGEFQRSPALVHLSGTIDEGSRKRQLEYYRTDDWLFVHQPKYDDWLRFPAAQTASTASFRPDDLAGLLASGLRSAAVFDREMDGAAATVGLEVQLDAAAAKRWVPNSTSTDVVVAHLWVRRDNLWPTRFRLWTGTASTLPRFTYDFRWDFRRFPPLELPLSRKTLAVPAGV